MNNCLSEKLILILNLSNGEYMEHKKIEIDVHKYFTTLFLIVLISLFLWVTFGR